MGGTESNPPIVTQVWTLQPRLVLIVAQTLYTPPVNCLLSVSPCPAGVPLIVQVTVSIVPGDIDGFATKL